MIIFYNNIFYTYKDIIIKSIIIFIWKRRKNLRKPELEIIQMRVVSIR